jgi:Raf kinase inhibitor-like YbhB/YbcL family protein
MSTAVREKLSLFLFFVMAAALVSQKSSGQAAAQPITLTSTAFKQGENIPDQFTCKGANVSPDLWWSGLPPGTQSLALIVEDPDAAPGPFTHWVVYNVLPDKGSLTANVTKDDVNGMLQGKNGSARIGYTGPCPPKDSGPHHYYFMIYALDNTLNLPKGADKAAVRTAMIGHVLAQGILLGRYEVK